MVDRAKTICEILLQMDQYFYQYSGALKSFLLFDIIIKSIFFIIKNTIINKMFYSFIIIMKNI